MKVRAIATAVAIASAPTAALVSINAHAQAGEAALEEIIVTARKHKENLQEVGLSVSAMTQTEISSSTGVPLGTVKTRTLLAMKKLRKALKAEIEELL